MEVLQHRSTSIFYINNSVQISLYYAYILGQLKIVPFRSIHPIYPILLYQKGFS